MIGLIAPVILATLLALAMGGRLGGFTSHQMRWWPLALLALAIQLPLYSPPFDTWPLLVAAGTAIGIVTMGLVLLVVLRNAIGPARGACLLAGLGIALNLSVMLANGGTMPRAENLVPWAFAMILAGRCSKRPMHLAPSLETPTPTRAA